MRPVAIRRCPLVLVALLLALTACGGGDDAPPPAPGTLSGTLAYVVSECRENRTSGYFFRQSVQVRQGEHDPVTVIEIPDIGPVPVFGVCKVGGGNSARYGPASPIRGAVQRLAVSADGATVAFELTDDFSAIGRNFLPADRKGILLVRPDGSGLRRLGPPSRQVSWLNPPGWFFNDLSFSPDGRTLAFPDLEPGTGGAATSQIFLQDVATGTRTQITHLSPATLSPATPAAGVQPGYPSTSQAVFVDEETVGFLTYANAGGSNPQGEIVSAIIKRDGSKLKVLPPVVAQAGSQINPTFIITGDRPKPVILTVPGEPVNHPPNSGMTRITEVFVVDGDNVVQLTNFHRADSYLPSLGVDRRTVFFNSSADPFGENPSEECQVFSIDRLGTNLRQLTRFRETDHSVHGCDFNVPMGSGCATQLMGQDARTQTFLFYSSCDPLGQNPLGGQIFAMRPDGSDLRQLTHTRGLVTEADGTVIGELPGPFVLSSGPR